MFTAKINDKEFKIKFNDGSASTGTIEGQPFEIDITKKDNKSFHIISDYKSYNLNVLFINKEEKTVKLRVNEKTFEIKITDELDKLLKTMGIQNHISQKNKDLKAPMPGLVTDILINIGDAVQKGDNLLVLEAMKMENNLKVEQDAIIKDIVIKKGNSVEKNQVLIIFE